MKRFSLIIQLFFCLFFCGFGFEASLNKIKSSLVPKSYTLKPEVKNSKPGNITGNTAPAYNNSKSQNNVAKAHAGNVMQTAIKNSKPGNITGNTAPAYNNSKSQNNVAKAHAGNVMQTAIKNSKPGNITGNTAPAYNNSKSQNNVAKPQGSTQSFGTTGKNNIVLANKNLEKKNINNNNTHLYKYLNTPPIFAPSSNIYSNLNTSAKRKVDCQIKPNNTKAGAQGLTKGKDTPKININYNYPAQKKPLTPLPKLADIKAYKNSNLPIKSLPKKIVNNPALSSSKNNIQDNNVLVLEASKQKANVLQRFLSIFGAKTKDDISSPVVSVVNNSQKLKSISRLGNKISQLTNNTVKELISDNNYRNLILRYGIFDEVQPDIIHNPKYLRVKHNPAQLSNEAQRIRELSLNQKYLKERLDKRVEEVSKNLLALHSQYPLLSDEQLRNLYNVRSIKDAGNVDLALNNLQLLDSIVSHVPILAPSNVTITSHFGPRKLNKSPLRMHAGIDLVSQNRSIYASAAGVVEFAGRDNIYGNFVVIKHANCKTKYGHLEKSRVRTGQIVKQGDLIGIEGATGRVTGRHLHLEVLINQKPVNPIDFLKYSLGTNYKNEVAYKKKCAMESNLSKGQLINISMPNRGAPIKKKQVHLRKPSNKKQKLL